METLYYIVSYGVLAMAFLPIVNLEVWWMRFLESLRPLNLFLLVLLFFTGLLFLPSSSIRLITLFLLAITAIVMSREMILYTTWSNCEVVESTDCPPDLTILMHNILMSNDDIEALERSVSRHDPDVLFLIEFTDEWQKAVDNIRKKFRFRLEHPLETGYGMALYSKYQLQNEQIRYLVKEDIPSIDSTIAVADGRCVRFFGIHPAPPAPQYMYDTRTKDREAYEVARLAKETDLPFIVAGDFNDINWSRPVKKFKADCEIKDPRIGRGFYPTFHANNIFINYPLDHIFLSDHFDLHTFEIIPLRGSDHHGLKAALVFNDQKSDAKISSRQ